MEWSKESEVGEEEELRVGSELLRGEVGESVLPMVMFMLLLVFGLSTSCFCSEIKYYGKLSRKYGYTFAAKTSKTTSILDFFLSVDLQRATRVDIYNNQ